MQSKTARLLARISAALMVAHLFLFWAAERQGTLMDFEPAHFKDSALLLFFIAVYLLLESYAMAREDRVVEEEVISITEESGGTAFASPGSAKGVFVNPYVLSAAIVGVALIVAGFVISGKGNSAGTVKSGLAPTASTLPVAPQPPAPGQKIAVTWRDTPIINKNAKVQLLEFGDFQCPFCGRFFTDSFLQIKKKYIDTGKVAYQHRDYPLPFHQNAQKAHEASRCALEQSEKKYWELHDWMYQNQNTLEVSSLKAQAKTMGLALAKFDQCLDSGKYAAAVKKDYDAGSGYGVSGTPSFFVDGELVVGAQPYATFEQKIDAALAAAK